MNKLSITDKLALDKFAVDEGEAHIIIDNEQCQQCKDKSCLLVCPAELYSEQNGQMTVEWAGCLECGTCRAVCRKGAIHWVYPRGGFGIIYRYA
jgi:Ferredoxin-like protein